MITKIYSIKHFFLCFDLYFSRWIYTINRAEARELVESSATVTVQKEFNIKPVSTIAHLQNDGNLSVISDIKTQ